MKIPVSLMTQRDLTEWLKTPFNPPEDGNEEEFDSEYWDIHERITSGLELLGKKSYTDGDFCPNSDFEESRVIGIELNERKLLCEELIPLCQHLLSKEQVEYEVMINHSLLAEADFWIFVTASSVKAYFEDRRHLTLFGLRESISEQDEGGNSE